MKAVLKRIMACTTAIVLIASPCAANASTVTKTITNGSTKIITITKTDKKTKKFTSTHRATVTRTTSSTSSNSYPETCSVKADAEGQQISTITNISKTIRKVRYYYKGSKTYKVVTTTITITKNKVAPRNKATQNIAGVASEANSCVKKLYVAQGYSLTVDNGLAKHLGIFSVSQKNISLRYSTRYIYHELGHYIAFIGGNLDKTTSFKKIYKAEKKYYTASDRTEITKNSTEYFAQSYYNYITNPAKLKRTRPKTYRYIKKTALPKIAVIYEKNYA